MAGRNLLGAHKWWSSLLVSYWLVPGHVTWNSACDWSIAPVRAHHRQSQTTGRHGIKKRLDCSPKDNWCRKILSIRKKGVKNSLFFKLYCRYKKVFICFSYFKMSYVENCEKVTVLNCSERSSYVMFFTFSSVKSDCWNIMDLPTRPGCRWNVLLAFHKVQQLN